MNFQLTDDQRMLGDTLHRYISNKYGFEARDRIARSTRGYSAEHWQRFADIGVIGAMFSEEHGGFGGTGFDLALVFETLGHGLVVEPFLTTVQSGTALARGGSEQHRNLLDGVMAGANIVAFAHSEQDAGYDMSTVTTTAAPSASGWVLNGKKSALQLGNAADNFIVSARSSGARTDTDGISLFVVARNTPGLEVQAYSNVDGGRSADLILDNVTVPADALLGAPGKAAETLVDCNGRAILALCAEALGAMEAAKQATLEYLQTRRQFGVPIGSFQALQHRMVDVLLEIEQSRSAVINAAALIDTPGVERERAVSAAKMTIGRAGARVAEECVQMHGGIGMTWELPLAHFAKRLIMIDHQLGDEDYHLERYIQLQRMT